MQQAADNLVRLQIRKGVADALHAYSWGRCEEECGRTYPGARLDEICGPATDRAKTEADRIISYFGRLTGFESPKVELDRGLAFLHDVFKKNAATPGHDRPPTPELFGWYLATQAMGEGVCWADSHPDHELRPPGSHFSYDHPSEYGGVMPWDEERAPNVLFGECRQRVLVLSATIDKGLVTERVVHVLFDKRGDTAHGHAVLVENGNVTDTHYGDPGPFAAMVLGMHDALRKPHGFVRLVLTRWAVGKPNTIKIEYMDSEPTFKETP